MIGDYQSDVLAARKALSAYEEKRRDLSRRELFWRADRWQQLFDMLQSAEDARDASLRQQIADRTLASAWLSQYEEQLYDALRDDVAWYGDFISYATKLAQSWAGQAAVATARGELHNDMLTAQLRGCERAVRVAEFAVDVSERRRRAAGALSPRLWTGGWNELRKAWDEEDQIYHDLMSPSSQGQAPPSAEWRDHASKLYGFRMGERLTWLRALEAYQRETLGLFDRSSPAADALRADLSLVAQALRRIEPARAPAPKAGSAIGVVVALASVMLIGAIAFNGLKGGGAAQPTATAAQPLQAAAQQVGASATELNAQGMELMARGDLTGAAARFESAIQADPGFYEPYNNLAFCLYESGQVDSAVTRWEEALARNPGSPDALAGLGMARLAQGRPDEGLASYRQALAIEPRYADETFLQNERLWSARAIADSRPLRQAPAGP